MGIDAKFGERIENLWSRHRSFVGGHGAILGDCEFRTSWATGNNRRDVAIFADRLRLDGMETFDIFGSPTHRVDLQMPLAGHLQQKFGLLIDIGTIPCCFDVAAIFRNCRFLLKPGGLSVHLAQLTGHFGRCFYNVHPSLFVDICKSNKFDILALEIRIPKYYRGIDRLVAKVSKFFGHPRDEFVGIEQSQTFVEWASPRSISWTSLPVDRAPLLPNDAILLCAIRWNGDAPFQPPISGYFASHASANANRGDGE